MTHTLETIKHHLSEAMDHLDTLMCEAGNAEGDSEEWRERGKLAWIRTHTRTALYDLNRIIEEEQAKEGQMT